MGLFYPISLPFQVEKTGNSMGCFAVLATIQCDCIGVNFLVEDVSASNYLCQYMFTYNFQGCSKGAMGYGTNGACKWCPQKKGQGLIVWPNKLKDFMHK